MATRSPLQHILVGIINTLQKNRTLMLIFQKTSHMAWEPFDSNTVQGTSVSNIRLAGSFTQTYCMFSNVTTMNEMVSAHTFWFYHKNHKTPQDRVTNACNRFTLMAVGPGEGILLYGWHRKPGVKGWQPELAKVLFSVSIHKTAICHLSLSSSNLRSLH